MMSQNERQTLNATFLASFQLFSVSLLYPSLLTMLLEKSFSSADKVRVVTFKICYGVVCVVLCVHAVWQGNKSCG